MAYIKKEIIRYLDDLAARKPAPGGGSAAAFAGALGAALLSMVSNYTAGKKGYEQHQGEIKRAVVSSERLRKEFMRLVDEDIRAYGRLSRVLKKKTATDSSLTKAYIYAAAVPRDVCRLAEMCMRLSAALLKYGNRNLIADTVSAAAICAAAFDAARRNAMANMSYLKGSSFERKTTRELKDLTKKMRTFRRKMGSV